MERAPELWSHRPFAKDTIAYAVNSICSLHSAGYVLWERLCTMSGQSSAHHFLQGTQLRLKQASMEGMSERQQGVFQDRYDPELNNWLARRHGGAGVTPASVAATANAVQGATMTATGSTGGEPYVP